jgi:hypothetical protein
MLKFFSSPLEPDAVAANLREIVDEEVVDPKSPTLYAGERPLVGWVNPDRFRISRRPPVYWALWWLSPGEWFKPIVEGTITSKDNRTDIKIAGGTPVWIKIGWVLALLGAAGLIGLLIVFGYPYSITHDPTHAGEKMLLGIIVLNVVAGIFVALPLIGWFMTKNDLPAIVKELKSRLRLEPQI